MKAISKTEVEHRWKTLFDWLVKTEIDHFLFENVLNECAYYDNQLCDMKVKKNKVSLACKTDYYSMIETNQI